MSRFPMPLTVTELSASVRFYTRLFAEEPSVLKPDYAQWILEDLRVNFAISTRDSAAGLNHLGIQAETEAELASLTVRLEDGGSPVIKEGLTTCCYAESEKSWIFDPDGLPWETYRTMRRAAVFASASGSTESRCCVSAAVAPVLLPRGSGSR